MGRRRRRRCDANSEIAMKRWLFAGLLVAVLAYGLQARCGGADYSFTADRRIRLEAVGQDRDQ